MRAGLVFVCAILAGGLSCARQARPDFPAPVGVEKSIHPIYVVDTKTFTVSGLTHTRTLANHRGCSGFYIAPHLLVTSTSVFFQNSDHNITTNAANIIIADGSVQLTVEEVVEVDEESGLAVISTVESGTSLPLREASASLPERLNLIGFVFEPVNSFHVLALHRWKRDYLYPVAGETNTEDRGVFMAKAKTFPRMCGAVVFDDEGFVAGIVHRLHYDRVSVINAAALRRIRNKVLSE